MVIALDKKGNPDPYSGACRSTMFQVLQPPSVDANRLDLLLGQCWKDNTSVQIKGMTVDEPTCRGCILRTKC